MNDGGLQIIILSNPVIGNNLKFKLINLQKGIYTLSLYNILGQLVTTKVLTHKGGAVTETLSIKQTLVAGIYQLRLSGNQINIIQQVIKN